MYFIDFPILNLLGFPEGVVTLIIPKDLRNSCGSSRGEPGSLGNLAILFQIRKTACLNLIFYAF